MSPARALTWHINFGESASCHALLQQTGILKSGGEALAMPLILREEVFQNKPTRDKMKQR